MIGTGNIGCRVVKYMRPFMNVITFDILENNESELPALISKVDCITLHIPKTGNNKAFIDKAIEYSKAYGGVFIGAHHCTLGSGTSDAAKRVWKSLARDYTSSGDVIFIGTAQ